MNPPIGADDRSWGTSPCSSCPTSPCCTRLPLHRFHIEQRSDFERAQEMVRTPHLELGLYESGWWMAYYLSPCRFLNPLDSKCLVHASWRQPAICRDYSSFHCWYKRVFAAGISPDFIRFDSRRLAALEQMIAFDEAGELTHVPSWDTMQDRLCRLPPEPADRWAADRWAAGVPVEGPALLFAGRPDPQPPSLAAASTPAASTPPPRALRPDFPATLDLQPSFPGANAPPPHLRAAASPASPVSPAPPPLLSAALDSSPPGSGGLTFPIRVPRCRQDLDLVRFRLGFQGVRVGIAGDTWMTIIGDPPGLLPFFVISYDHIDALLSAFEFDAAGTIIRAPKLAGRDAIHPA